MQIKRSDLEQIIDIIIAFHSEHDFLKLLSVIISKMRMITHCEAGTLYVLYEGALHFTIMQNEKLGVFSQGDEIELPPVYLNSDNITNVSAYCAINNKMVNIDDVYKNNEFNFQGPEKYDELTGFRTKSMIVFPMTGMHNQVTGVIQLINAKNPEGEIVPFDKGIEFLMQSLADIAAMTLLNVNYMAEIKDLFYSFVEVMSQAVDERTPYNAKHSKRMAEYVKWYVRYLREVCPPDSPYYLDENREEQLIMTTLLHDIGKLVTPLEIMDKASRLADLRVQALKQRVCIKKLQDKVDFLCGYMTEKEYETGQKGMDEIWAFVERVNTAPFLSERDILRIKTLENVTYTDESGSCTKVFEEYDIDCLSVRKGTLTNKERDIMREHVTVTGRFLDRIAFGKQYEHVPEWAKSHHEYLDGTGYPNRLSGDNIAVEVCILTILDIYDSLTASDRPYKKAVSHSAAIDILRSMAAEGKVNGELVNLFDKSKAWDML